MMSGQAPLLLSVLCADLEHFMTDAELASLWDDLESDRVERKASLSDPAKIRQAICAFANDMPNHGKPGVVLIGANDDGRCAGLAITDELLRTLSDMRSDGNILPLPSMVVQKRTVCGCELAVVIVQPADAPPVRLHGRVWIRVGPRRAMASAEEERRLAEKRRSRDLPFDLHTVRSATLQDLDEDLFLREYVAASVAPEVIDENERTTQDQLSSLRFASARAPSQPTVLGLLTVGKTPADYIPGAYVQFLRIDGVELADPIADQKDVHGPIPTLLSRLEDVLTANVRVATDLQSAHKEIQTPDYPIVALQQIIRNAIMHRDYETSNAPVRVTWFRDRVEIQNPGGPFGQVTRANFGQPGIADYRNPHLAEAMKNLGYVQKFGVGIALARRALDENGNPGLEYDVEDNYILATVRART
jgi:ATP-dependent DNA helicase RecG